MTLCTAWIRKAGDNEELVFATDSCLSAGERWPTGIKLFDLPRKDALICFAGRTDRAYPLILNLITSLRYNKDFQDKAKDVSDLALFVSDLFTQLVYLIDDYGSQDIEELRSGAKFLFGGWSWKINQFVLFKIFYNEKETKFVFEDEFAGKRTRYAEFIGDDDVVPLAEALYYKEFEGKNSEKVLDMEPLKVLTTISRDSPKITTVSGALQIAKIYPSGNNEFFGVMWPSYLGKPHFLGKEYHLFDKPDVRYFDPDTLVIHELPLPERLTEITESFFGDYTSFVELCYPNGIKRSNLNKKEKQTLFEIFKHSTYQQFIEANNRSADEELNEETEDEPAVVEEEDIFEAVGTNSMEAVITPVVETEVAQPEDYTEENNGDNIQA